MAGLLDFVNSKTGWGIAPGGGLDQKAGLVKKLDLLVKEWVTAVADGGVWLRLWAEAEKYVARCRGGKAAGP